LELPALLLLLRISDREVPQRRCRFDVLPSCIFDLCALPLFCRRGSGKHHRFGTTVQYRKHWRGLNSRTSERETHASSSCDRSGGTVRSSTWV